LSRARLIGRFELVPSPQLLSPEHGEPLRRDFDLDDAGVVS
jgi:hypothetical protein